MPPAVRGRGAGGQGKAAPASRAVWAAVQCCRDSAFSQPGEQGTILRRPQGRGQTGLTEPGLLLSAWLVGAQDPLSDSVQRKAGEDPSLGPVTVLSVVKGAGQRPRAHFTHERGQGSKRSVPLLARDFMWVFRC